jgi:hypothetical protein
MKTTLIVIQNAADHAEAKALVARLIVLLPDARAVGTGRRRRVDQRDDGRPDQDTRDLRGLGDTAQQEGRFCRDAADLAPMTAVDLFPRPTRAALRCAVRTRTQCIDSQLRRRIVIS